MYGDQKTPPNASNFTPKFVPGARLPHAWIRLRISSDALEGIPPVDVSYVKEFSQDEIRARKYSTLDPVRFDAFTLIVSSREAWSSRFQELDEAIRSKNSKVKLQLWAVDTDFEFVDVKGQELFEKGAGLSEGGALLVRPDQHLLACPAPDASAGDLETLVLEHLGLKTSGLPLHKNSQY